jgi:hypothetical protein
MKEKKRMEEKLNCTVCGKEYVWHSHRNGNSSCRHSKKRCYACRCRNASRNIKTRLVNELGGACSRCGYNTSVAALDFHHVDPSQKEFGVSTKLRYGYNAVLAEAKKCVLLCKNCHAELHVKPC